MANNRSILCSSHVTNCSYYLSLGIQGARDGQEATCRIVVYFTSTDTVALTCVERQVPLGTSKACLPRRIAGTSQDRIVHIR
jgi:hypothetical protein